MLKHEATPSARSSLGFGFLYFLHAFPHREALVIEIDITEETKLHSAVEVIPQHFYDKCTYSTKEKGPRPGHLIAALESP